MTKVIGLTGGIGSGKTTVANYFQEMGVPVYIADDGAKRVMQSKNILEEVKSAFGGNIFDNDILTFNGYNIDCELNEVEESNWSLCGRIITVSIPSFMEFDITVEKLTSNEFILKQDGINEDTGAVEVVRYYMTRN